MNRKSLILVLAAVLAGTVVQSRGGTSERVVADRFTGLAIAGFDPVAYFTDGVPREGREDLETDAGGAIWRFRNAGNRAVFLERPDIYAPQFGGYDPIDVARGVARAGRAQLWLIVEGRLYLFGDEDNRSAFLKDTAQMQRSALQAWPGVEARLAR